jgi:hypothetical protein
MKSRYNIIWLLLLFLWSCGKKPVTLVTIPWDGSIVSHAPVPVQKSTSKKVFAHILPWFETPATNNGTYGQHWTMTNQIPPTHIASWYYPMIGPYASGDTTVIDYQLLLMKLSGIDGVFIDWPGTLNYSDFAMNAENTNIIISRLGKVGLKYAIVYEDQNLQYTNTPLVQAQADMNYLQANYFSDSNYEQFSGKPLLLDFGPQQLTNSSDWTTAFSGLTTKPSFFTLEYQTSEAGSNATGAFTWVEQNNLTNLNNFYSTSYNPGAKISAAYSGFNSFYVQGGWPGPSWVITPTVSLFQQTLTLALQQPGDYIQLVTWNDYGEGTIIEPTTQFQYNFLTTLQQQLGVQSTLSQSDLQTVTDLYNARVHNTLPVYNQNNLNELDQVYYDIVSLKMDSARWLLNNF